uniref:Uncharacterized protein n=1 Tax=Arundo donax TaxID=35708 RepID=A0A0A8YF05_ARUDO
MRMIQVLFFSLRIFFNIIILLSLRIYHNKVGDERFT